MHPANFKRWRKSLGLSQKEAAHALGLKRRMVQYYEKGERDGDTVTIPVSVRLACYAIAHGVTDYQGPEEDGEAKTKAKSKPKPAKAKGKDREKSERKSKKERSAKKPEDSVPAPMDGEKTTGDDGTKPTDANGAPPASTKRAPGTRSKALASRPRPSSAPSAKAAGTARARTSAARTRKPDGGKPPA